MHSANGTTYTTNSHLDSQNAFGAVIRTYFGKRRYSWTILLSCLL